MKGGEMNVLNLQGLVAEDPGQLAALNTAPAFAGTTTLTTTFPTSVLH
jgi:hypothetical protein